MQEDVFRRQLKKQVPGAAAAWESAVQRWGKLSLRTAGFSLHSKAVLWKVQAYLCRPPCRLTTC